MGGEFLHTIRSFISNYLVRESTKDRGSREKSFGKVRKSSSMMR